MTAPEDQNGLREALARDIREWDDRTPGRRGCTLVEYLVRPASPLAPYLAAEAEITRLKAERDTMAAKLAKATETYTDPKGAVWAPVPAWVHFAVCQSSRDARSEITRLKEGMEAARAALELAEDVMSRSPFSTMRVWPNGTGSQEGITTIRAALATLSPKEQP